MPLYPATKLTNTLVGADAGYWVPSPSAGKDGTFDFQPQLTSEPTAPEPYMEWKLKNAMISGYSMSHDDGSIDDLAVDPTDPNADVPTGTWLLDATFQGGVTVATEHFILQGDQCLVF